ncbi:MAG TPA: ankyrin repeat domain-containing protein [Streptosporangiaceae bacterium]|nr:ankyrin repeat domain-containing protein [Streptosporangiaceae bacterium]
MPVIPLPARPSLENLRNQARTLQQLVQAGLPGALDTVAEFHPRLGSVPPGDPRLTALSRADAQLVIARQYGFPSWPRLRQHLAVVAEYSRSPHVQPTGGPVAAAAAGPASLADDFLRLACLIYDGYDPDRVQQARQILAEHPEVALASIYTSAAAGEHENVSALLQADPALARRQGGPFDWDPLLYAAYSRVVSPRPGRSTLEAARLLLAAGADPNAGYLWAGLPSPFTALAGALGRGEGAPPAHPQALELATLLLESGADANDSQALYNCGLQSPPDDGYLRLLLRYGLGAGDGGPWHRRLAPAHHSPRQLLDQELIKAVAKNLPARVALLLAHGADPAGLGTRHPVYGQHDSWQLATMGGHHEVLDLLAATGPAPEPDPVLSFLGACMAGDERQVRTLRTADPGIAAEAVAREPDLLVDAAEQDRPAAVRLLAAAGFDVNALRRAGPRNGALHEAAWNGSMAMVELLLELGADPALRDAGYRSTPAGWARTNGKVAVAAYLTGLEGTG